VSSDDASDRDGLGERALALLQSGVESYEQLLILLHTHGSHPREWSAEDLSTHLNMSPAIIQHALQRLEAGHLLGRRSMHGADRYAYSPSNAALEQAVADLARVYGQNPLLIIRVMSNNAIQRVRTAALRTFADAFLLRRDK
jgi:hypothetical protein